MTRYKKIQQYLSFSSLNEEIDYDRKYGEKRMHTEPLGLPPLKINEKQIASQSHQLNLSNLCLNTTLNHITTKRN